MLVVNGRGDMGGPPSATLDYLLARRAARVTAIHHPLTEEDGNVHLITEYRAGQQASERVVRLPSRPPWTYPLDALVPPRTPRVDGWFGFNNLACARGLLERRLGRADTVTYWAIDFVPNRFGAGTLLTRAYEAFDRYCCLNADLRVELSRQALEGRDANNRLAAGAGARRLIAPIGVWLERLPVTDDEAWQRRRLVFLGHLVERMGVDTAIKAVSVMVQRGADVTLDIVGRGPSEKELRTAVRDLGLEHLVTFHGFVSREQLERVLAEASVALAPYSTRVENFTRFADPAKLKSYLAAGLPIVVTEVPPNAHELEREGGGQVVPDDPVAFADAIEQLLLQPEEWKRRRTDALQYARRFDWNGIVESALTAAGFTR
ncbi:MAG TPA: glycosyltransferase [Solirubrobacteraceae bacterium]|jgi:glycosyltransferase involved in cell wall biosynthesis